MTGPPANASELTSLLAEAAGLLWRSARDPVFGADKARHAVAIVRARLLFRDCNLGVRVSADGRVVVEPLGSLSIGDHVHFKGGMFPTRLRAGPAGSLAIGDRCVFNYGVQLDAHERVEVGSGCLFGSMVRISDSALGRRGPVVVGNHVWVAHGVTVAPGVTVGDGAVLSAGAVVTHDVPPGHLAIGNPARAMALKTVGAPR